MRQACRIALAILVLLSSGCANNRLPWPAKIGSIDGFSDDQRSQLLDVIDDLNEAAGTTMISQDDLPNHFTIYYQLVSPPADNPNRAGYAVVESDKATIQISTSVFDPTRGSREDLLRAVAWHENGHAAGLVHVPTQGQIMYAYSTVYSAYTQDAITTFLNSILKSSGINSGSPNASVSFSGG